MNIIFKLLTLIIPFLTSCTFGSVGNKKKEDIVILESFIQLIVNIPGNFQPLLHSYDNQTDSNLSQFTIVSGTNPGNTYNLTILEENSFLIMDRLEFRFNPPEKPFGSFSKTHTPYTIPLDLPPNDPYGKTYISLGQTINSFMTSNSNGIGLGSVSRNLLGNINSAPQGILASTTFFIKRWDINIQIDRINSSTKQIIESRKAILSIRDYHHTILPRCKTEIQKDQNTDWILGLNYSRLFRDYFDSNVRIELLNDLFADTISNPDTLIPITDLHSHYKHFLKNLRSDDAVIIQESCLL